MLKEWFGSKDQFLINEMIMKNCRSKLKNSNIVWINYKRTFESVPNEWKLKSSKPFRNIPSYHNIPKIYTLSSRLELWNKINRI